MIVLPNAVISQYILIVFASKFGRADIHIPTSYAFLDKICY